MRNGFSRSSRFLVVWVVLALSCTFALAQEPVLLSPTTVASVLQNLRVTFVGGNTVSSVLLTGDAVWGDGPNQKVGSIELLTSLDGAQRITLHLDTDSVEQFGPYTDFPRTCTSTKNGAVREIPAHNCWFRLPWFLPAFATQSTVENSQVAYQLFNDDAPSVLHIRQQLVLPSSVASQKVADTVQRLSAVDIYVDPQTFLPAKLTYALHPDDDLNRSIPVEVRYSAYRKIAGIAVPSVIEQKLNGTPLLQIRVTGAQVH